MIRKLILFLIIPLSLIFETALTSACQAQTEIQDTPTASNAVASHVMPTSTAQIVEESDDGKASSRTDIIWEMLEQVSKDRALRDLSQLTGEQPICTDNGCSTITNRGTGSEGLQWAKNYVYEELVRLGYSVELQDWSRSGYADQNVIARKLGMVSSDEEIYFVAHLDGVTPGGIERSPAADDNATGVVSILELARVLSNRMFNSSVVLLFSTGEEQGALGVRSFVDQLSPEQISAIRYVVDVEMLGYDADRDGVMQFWSGDHPPSLLFAQRLSEIINNYQLDLVPRVVSGCT